MSPSEEQLRAALRADEPSAPDAGPIIEQAVAARRTRRRNLAGATGAVLMVLAIAGVGVAVKRSGSTNDVTAPAAAGTAPAVTSSATGVASSGSASSGPTSAGGVPYHVPADSNCPTTLPNVTIPGDTAGWSTPLISSDAASILLCTYDPTAPSVPVGHTLFDRTQSAQLAATLNNAPIPAEQFACPAMAGPKLLLIASTGAGTKVVEADTVCGTFTDGVGLRVSPDLATQVLNEAGYSPTDATNSGKASHGPGPAK
ncbi:hypothetical protein SAMN05892883_4378 [Jatrophihabitans sp. GAS493]|uniref:hypothetical protein n=1 Tax=Jatrophihabitans sp. GAS493 TaxID=1907575 RepID=UPI000BB99F4D|nr:hypothetical protein [Jatrophihabitans sp. GAS493]SOD75173.1 hypothetical protein SAMN05892883_4378 [Jatrophihabitans sp. GAS493]